MKKRFLLAIILIPAAVFAAGLRIDLQVLGEKLQKKPDHNVETLAKMGIDPGQIDFKGKPWWTFKDEDSLFKRLFGWNPVKQMSDESWEASQTIKKSLGGGFAEGLQAQADAAATQARLNQQRIQQQVREMER
ncbi:MAG: hypothetical protein V1882_09160 [Candidatus Omnitrophota bacterium]